MSRIILNCCLSVAAEEFLPTHHLAAAKRLADRPLLLGETRRWEDKLALTTTSRTMASCCNDSPSDASEAAFELLLARHAPMVQATCRRLLHNATDAEDAFQATFLVLARNAGSIQRREILGSWLYGVAYRISRKANAKATLRRIRETQAGARPGSLSEGRGLGLICG